MALRLPKAQLPTELGEKMIEAFGAVFEPTEVIWHNPGVAAANTEFAGRLATWDALDESLKSFAHMAVASLVGCSWCLDINYFQARNQGLDLAKASQVPNWRASEAFTPLERDVMEYAEAMSVTPPTVTDEQYGVLLDALGPAAMVELTAYVAFANMAARNNIANGVSSQGFSDSCEVPLAGRPAAGGPSA
ncbi:carboxymuconolactone decarboxylase family protein [Streptomyces sp. 1331.2]|uniref:carboxymuconolactone decarboxylase family protein n=1 Tax=Streptomyces sp. 1331.2 TaxID=1938835 RepID=UPI000BD40576|nr:carboxymuconolactone decarboxylase family protein [Streptomyces sp. 1331.2]SOB85481.1 Alkylhydroperoxidase family enzyme, contains CxxC motif [Streptomyces sp. 1331.2]